MRILLSAFAYSPILGSECGVGWHWARVLAQHHDVTVLTHAWFREDVERALAEQPQPRLKVVYFTVDPWLGQFSRPLLDSQLYYVWWQWKVVPFARELHAQMQFDVVHHLTWGSLRYPSWMGSIGARFIVGPLGGGERAPARFFAGLPLKERLKEVPFARRQPRPSRLRNSACRKLALPKGRRCRGRCSRGRLPSTRW